MSKYVIIPDVHGRLFWKDVCTKAITDDNVDKIIFLGDYLDPYEYEEIYNEFTNFKDILQFKKDHPDRVVLLLGNHDTHYITTHGRGSRWSYAMASQYSKVFFDNLDLFDMTFSCSVKDKIFYFSHAGITQSWLQNFVDEEAEESRVNFVYSNLPNFNAMLHNEESRENILFPSLGAVSFERGGGSETGSIVWADYHDHLYKHELIPDIIQVFGHTQQESDPINIGEKLYCLDCRRAFILNDNGVITEMTGEELPTKDLDKLIEQQKDRLDKMLKWFF